MARADRMRRAVTVVTLAPRRGAQDLALMGNGLHAWLLVWCCALWRDGIVHARFMPYTIAPFAHPALTYV